MHSSPSRQYVDKVSRSEFCTDSTFQISVVNSTWGTGGARLRSSGMMGAKPASGGGTLTTQCGGRAVNPTSKSVGIHQSCHPRPCLTFLRLLAMSAGSRHWLLTYGGGGKHGTEAVK